jgi:choline kinase
MKAVILAGSLSNRIGDAPVTKVKPMVDIRGGINCGAAPWSSWTS